MRTSRVLKGVCRRKEENSGRKAVYRVARDATQTEEIHED